MHAPIALSTAQEFEIERFSRAIEANADPEQLRSLAKQLLKAWHTQKATTNWLIQQQLAPTNHSGVPNGAAPWNAPTC